MSTALPERRVALVDLLDRVLVTGVVVTGDVTLAIADVDLVRVSLRALITSIDRDHADVDRDAGLHRYDADTHQGTSVA